MPRVAALVVAMSWVNRGKIAASSRAPPRRLAPASEAPNWSTPPVPFNLSSSCRRRCCRRTL